MEVRRWGCNSQPITLCGLGTALHASRAANRDCCGPTPPVAGFLGGGSGGGTSKSGRGPSLLSEPVVNAGMAMWRHMTLVLTTAGRGSGVGVSTPVQAPTVRSGPSMPRHAICYSLRP